MFIVVKTGGSDGCIQNTGDGWKGNQSGINQIIPMKKKKIFRIKFKQFQYC